GASDASADLEAIAGSVRAILEDVRTRGDLAVLEYTRRFDDRPNAAPGELEISPEQIDRAIASLDPGVHAALERAAHRIRSFHALQVSQIKSTVLDDGTGIRAELIVRPLERAGVYVPGGTAAYPSTVLM